MKPMAEVTQVRLKKCPYCNTKHHVIWMWFDHYRCPKTGLTFVENKGKKKA